MKIRSKTPLLPVTRYVDEYKAANPFDQAPSVQEVADHFGFASKSTAQARLEAAEAAGQIRRGRGPRQIKVLVEVPHE